MTDDQAQPPEPQPPPQPEPKPPAARQSSAQPKPRLDLTPYMNGHKSSQTAGLIVCVMSTIFVVGIIGLLFLQAGYQHKELGTMAATSGPGTSVIDPYYLLEQETLRLRASRASIAQLYRHFVAISGLIVSMSMVLLGAILIFDRVLAPEPNEITGSVTGEGWFEAGSPFPGLMLCLMGAATVALNLYYSGPKAASFVTRDIPAYLQDLNWSRNAAGLPPCFGANSGKGANSASSCSLDPATISPTPE